MKDMDRRIFCLKKPVIFYHGYKNFCSKMTRVHSLVSIFQRQHLQVSDYTAVLIVFRFVLRGFRREIRDQEIISLKMSKGE